MEIRSFGAVSKAIIMEYYKSPPLEEVPQAEEDTPALLSLFQITFLSGMMFIFTFETAHRGDFKILIILFVPIYCYVYRLSKLRKFN